MIRTRASTDRFGASCSSGAAAGEAGGAPGAGVSGRIGVALTTRGRTLRSRAIGNALPASSDRPQPPDAASKTSDAGKTEANRRVLVLATSVPSEAAVMPPARQTARPAACPQRGIPRGNAAPYRNIVTKRVLPPGHKAQRFGVVACRSAARHQISRVRGSEGEVVVSEEELGDLFKRYASYVATIGIRLLGRDDELDDLVQEVFIEAYRGYPPAAQPRRGQGVARAHHRAARRPPPAPAAPSIVLQPGGAAAGRAAGRRRGRLPNRRRRSRRPIAWSSAFRFASAWSGCSSTSRARRWTRSPRSAAFRRRPCSGGCAPPSAR